MLVGKVAAGGPNTPQGRHKIDAAYLDDVARESWFEIRLEDEDANSQLEQASERLKIAAQGASRSVSTRSGPRSRPATTSPRACSRWSRCTWR